MPSPTQPPTLRGRQAEAAVHDVLIIDTAFTVLTTNPRATMAQIAEQAGVGVASLYRRYPTRQALAHELCLRAMGSITSAASACSASLDDPAQDPWTSIEEFFVSAIAAGAGTMRALAGTFEAGEDLAREATTMNEAIQQVVSTALGLGVIRADVTAADITQMFEMLRAIRVGSPQRSDVLRQRYLELFLSALRDGPHVKPLSVDAPLWQEVSANWNQAGPT